MSSPTTKGKPIMDTTPNRRLRMPAILVTILCAGAALSLATACDPPPPSKHGALVLVVGNRANMPAPTLTARAEQLVKTAIHEQDAITIIDVSGSPQVQGTLSTTSSCDSSSACQNTWNSSFNEVDTAISKIRPSAPQADLVAALAVAGREFASVTGPKRLIVIDSGVQTVGALPVQAPGVLDGDGTSLSAIAASLKSNGSLPDLRGVDVLLTGIGWTYAPQAAPPERVRKRLDELWHDVVAAAAPQSLTADLSPPQPTKPAAGLPKVSTVDFTPPPPPCNAGTLRLRADQVGFLPNSASFRNGAQARAVLAPVAASLKAAGSSATLTGTTAEPETNPTSPNRLSLERARAVKGLLVQLGVPAARLSVAGVGVHFSGFVRDTDAKGHLVEALAIGNRLVIVTAKTFSHQCPSA